jgi:hypothetical protein
MSNLLNIDASYFPICDFSQKHQLLLTIFKEMNYLFSNFRSEILTVFRGIVKEKQKFKIRLTVILKLKILH